VAMRLEYDLPLFRTSALFGDSHAKRFAFAQPLRSYCFTQYANAPTLVPSNLNQE
jgi:hypothetical protein